MCLIQHILPWHHVNSSVSSHKCCFDIKKTKYLKIEFSLKIFQTHTCCHSPCCHFSCLLFWRDAIKHSIPLGLFIFLFLTAYFSAWVYLFFSSSVSFHPPSPGSAALLVPLLLPGLAAQIQMDYCKPVNLSESVAQGWQVTARQPVRVCDCLSVKLYPSFERPRIRCHSQHSCVSLWRSVTCRSMCLDECVPLYLHLMQWQAEIPEISVPVWTINR